ncbi:hypothetical protein N624_1369 [Levilactobacillus brevis]|nr:hypothetical protein N624_1369 [Levilactobacillus brevis]
MLAGIIYPDFSAGLHRTHYPRARKGGGAQDGGGLVADS